MQHGLHSFQKLQYTLYYGSSLGKTQGGLLLLRNNGEKKFKWWIMGREIYKEIFVLILEHSIFVHIYVYKYKINKIRVFVFII